MPRRGQYYTLQNYQSQRAIFHLLWLRKHCPRLRTLCLNLIREIHLYYPRFSSVISSNGIGVTIYDVIEKKMTILAHHPIYLPRQYGIFTLVNAETAFSFSECRCTSKILAFNVFSYRTTRPPNMLSQQYTTAATRLGQYAYAYGVSDRAYPVNAQRFNLVSNRWTSLTKKPLGVSIRFTSVWDDCIYLLSAVPMCAVEIYNTTKEAYGVANVPMSGRTVLSFQSNGELFMFKENDTVVRWDLRGNRIEVRSVECPRDRLSQGVLVYQGKATWLLVMKAEKREFEVELGRFGSSGVTYI